MDALQKAKRVDTIPSTPETFVERIRETYPFHPSIRDIVARFAENRGYQKTRALIRLMRLAVRGALARDDAPFLIGLQHLDFNDQATLEEIRKINPAYGNAISRDVADRGQALAERIDQADGSPTASDVAKVLLMSSLSAAETPLRGLTDGELIETLVDPLAWCRRSRARSAGFRARLGICSRASISASSSARPRTSRPRSRRSRRTSPRSRSISTLREKLREVFKPRLGQLYSERMAILPALDEIQLEDERPTLVILERPADKLPQDFVDWWNRQDLQNRVLVLTADPNAVTTLRTERAANAGDRKGRGAHSGDSTARNRRRWRNSKACEIARPPTFTSALRETFKTIVFPMTKALRRVDDFRMEFDRNDYSGEQQIIDTLTKRGKFIPSDQFDAKFETIRLDAEDILFDADAVQAVFAEAQRRRAVGLVLVAEGRPRPARQDLGAARVIGAKKKGWSPRSGNGERELSRVRTISRRTRWRQAGSRST